MRKPTKMGCAALTLMGLAAGAARADDAGIVRISDRPAANAAPASMSTTVVAGNNAAGAMVDGTCQDGAMAGGGSGGYDGTGAWYSPIRGFRQPVTAPVYRDAIIYYRYWPNKWYGEPGFGLKPQFPMVYMPTDTTQLGFYYARVPQWLPNPSMYPPPPRPSDWNRRMVYSGGDGAVYGPSDILSDSGNSRMMPTPATAPPQGPTPVVPQTSPTPAAPPPAPPSAVIESQPISSAGAPSPAGQGQPIRSAGAPSPAAQDGGVQPAAATSTRHWLLDDLRNFSRRSASPIPTEASPNQ